MGALRLGKRGGAPFKFALVIYPFRRLIANLRSPKTDLSETQYFFQVLKLALSLHASS